MTLRAILADMITQARAARGQEVARQLGHGMGVVLRVDTDLQLTVWVTRAGQPPSDNEMDTTLKHAGAPKPTLEPAGWKRGRSRYSGLLYISATWQLQPTLTD